ncbi:hypothetical protein WJX74_006265 [Apatococcus lobatus]|uniref:Protein transport protein Sec61 subunit beta n=2 Tax=Apatococcus TaxID=904362 RepID=A0AAW1SZZ1_9CHLO
MVPRAGPARPNGPPPGSSGGLRRRPGRSLAGPRSQQGAQFYTEEMPGLRLSPLVVICISIGFILFVTVLHVVGKVTRS